jgi:hypothetical protein
MIQAFQATRVREFYGEERIAVVSKQSLPETFLEQERFGGRNLYV